MSMHDGVVLYTTPSITSSLGFPRDMWLGRSFIDFVHPKDRPTFASQITSGTTTALAEARNSNFKDTKQTLYVMLRQYRGLKSYGYGVTTKTVNYEPFKLTLTFREAPDENCISNQMPYKTTPSVNSSMLLVISATPVKSVYKMSDEVFTAQKEHTKFTTRHTASGMLSHVDGTASLLGFLPQDMLSRNIMEFYHPEDMKLLKEVYETIMEKGQTAGASFCGKPYRFLTHNGTYLTIETEWSIFVNPWSHHLEFVIGYHHVKKGPSNPNVLASTEMQSQFPEQVINESKMIREEILKLLSEPIMRPNDTVKQQVSKRCQALASFMETLMEEVTKPSSRADLKLDLPQEADLTFSERDSVMLIGEISPHHDYFDSKSSSETPPSYNQLNYNENLQRFFDSRPITELDIMKMDQTDTHELETRTANLSPTQCFGESGGSESAGNMSSASNANMESITNTSTGTSNGSSNYIPPTLTEALLCKHNEDMEKLIIKRHKVSRVHKGGEKNKKAQEQHSHGVKRSGSHSWEGEVHKTFKQQHVNETQKSVTPFPTQTNPQPYQNANVDLWPPFSVSLTTIQSTHTTAHATHFATSSIFPAVYYIPQNISSQDQHGSIQAVQYMPGLLYQSMMYPHPSPFYQMQFQPQQTQSSINESIYNTTFQFDKANMAMPNLQKIPTPIGSGSQNQSTSFQRPPSQATSVKADMGSTSASVVNRALSESSKKGQVDSPAIDFTNQLNHRNNDKTTSEDESSHSSFYSSFLKTDEGQTSSNEERNEGKDDMQWEKTPKIPIKRPNPHWLDNINVTPELIYRYQISTRTLRDVLKDDLCAMKNIQQPDLVNDQLNQLYIDLELEGLSAKLSLESSSGSSGEENYNSVKQRRKKFQYNKLVLVYEENCPLPSD
ncbi:hypothetical protein ACKWTF_010400 [Chironomus riparius]